MPPEYTLFSLVHDVVRRRVREAEERSELLVPDWRDTILAVYGRMQQIEGLPDGKDELTACIEPVAEEQIARESARFRASHADALASSPPPLDHVLDLLKSGDHVAAVEAYRRQVGVGLLVARDVLAGFAETHDISIPDAWRNRKRFR